VRSVADGWPRHAWGKRDFAAFSAANQDQTADTERSMSAVNTDTARRWLTALGPPAEGSDNDAG
jgi:hypothetical protein